MAAFGKNLDDTRGLARVLKQVRFNQPTITKNRWITAQEARTMKNKIIFKLSLMAIGITLFTSCASTKVTMDSEYQGFLPRPSRVLVYDFAVSPDEVELDSGLSGDIKSLVDKTPRTDQERAIGRQLAAALSIHLVKEIGALGIQTIQASTNTLVAGRALAIKGQFISIDEGNQAERVVIGCGLGRTDVRTLVEAYDFNNGKKVLVEQFGLNAKSGDKPGMAETMGVGGLAGHLATSAVVSTGLAVGSEEFSANVNADADRTAKDIAKQIKYFYISQGWLQQ